MKEGNRGSEREKNQFDHKDERSTNSESGDAEKT